MKLWLWRKDGLPAIGAIAAEAFIFAFMIMFFHFKSVNEACAAEKLEITLSEAIKTALGENLSLKAEGYSVPIAEAGVILSEGEFDPALSLGAEGAYRKGRSVSAIMGNVEETLDADIGFGGKLPTGTAYELKWGNERIKSDMDFLELSPYHRSEISLTVSQPLLKDFGREVQESSINVARNNLRISEMRQEGNAVDVALKTLRAYWELYYSLENLKVSEISLDLANRLLDEVRAKIQAGVLAPVEVYKAEAEAATRHKEMLDAQKAVDDAADRLRVVMNLSEWDAEIIPKSSPPDVSEPEPVEGSVDYALKNRTELRQALVEKKSKEILRAYYENQRHPDLDLMASAGISGLDGNWGGALDEMLSGDYYSWRLGVMLSVPIGNRAAKGSYLKAKYEEEKAGASVQELRLAVRAEVRVSWRALKVGAETISSAGKIREASEKSLKAEEERFRVGMATLNDVLKVQEEYAKALSLEKRACVDYAIALGVLEKSKGSLTESAVMDSLSR